MLLCLSLQGLDLLMSDKFDKVLRRFRIFDHGEVLSDEFEVDDVVTVSGFGLESESEAPSIIFSDKISCTDHIVAIDLKWLA